MSNHYLLVDDFRRVYFDCEKLLIIGSEELGRPSALQSQPFDMWLRVVNEGFDPPSKSNRYALALPEAEQMYTFLVDSEWKARIVSLDSDDFDVVEETYKCVGEL
jgi:hypothetical protein